jgi:hypothetical protein
MTDDPENDPYDPETNNNVAYQEKIKRERDEKLVRGQIETRKNAYIRVFDKGIPSVADRELVKADLQRFCRHLMTAYSPDEREHVLLTGRQEVYLRIDDFTRLSVDTLVVKYTTGA